jgi:hypothetical protein
MTCRLGAQGALVMMSISRGGQEVDGVASGSVRPHPWASSRIMRRALADAVKCINTRILVPQAHANRRE